MELKINTNEFLKYIINHEIKNITYIKGIKLNNKSITVKLDKDMEHFIFNDFFNKNDLYIMIIFYLSLYIKENEINYPYDKDYLKYKYEKLNIKYV